VTGFTPIANIRKKITPKELYKGEASHYYADVLKPQTPEAPPAAPTIDDAAKQRDTVDRLRRRRGVYANIFAGAATANQSGKLTLGG
jgi:hypothetical protein